MSKSFIIFLIILNIIINICISNISAICGWFFAMLLGLDSYFKTED
jgi:hypothetical protein